MARPVQFDRDEVLDRAMALFWSRGYEATSVDDLLQATGLGRQSLYNAFGDKHRLFLEALDRYCLLTDQALHACLDGAPSIRDAINKLFLDVVNGPDESKRSGCMIVNTAIELAARDAAAGDRVSAAQRAFEKVFFRALQVAQERGELPAHKDARALSRFLVCALEGLRVAAKARTSPAALRDMASVALGTLD